MKITLKEVTQGLEKAKASNYNTDLFSGDQVTLEQFDKEAYKAFFLANTDYRHDQGQHDKFVETVVAVGHESDFYLITAVHTDFNGEQQVSFTEKPLTLKGFNYFTRDLEEDMSDVYNQYLQDNGYDITITDIEDLGELNTQYNVRTLRFQDDKDNTHYLTVNSRGQLSSVKMKPSAREVKSSSTFQSAFS